jgi:hypothetical protein
MMKITAIAGGRSATTAGRKLPVAYSRENGNSTRGANLNHGVDWCAPRPLEEAAKLSK